MKGNRKKMERHYVHNKLYENLAASYHAEQTRTHNTEKAAHAYASHKEITTADNNA
jgi:hypothetical protein